MPSPEQSDIPPIHSEAAYWTALGEASALVDADPDPKTPAGERLNALATLIQCYEARWVPLDAGRVIGIKALAVDDVDVGLDRSLPYESGDRGMP